MTEGKGLGLKHWLSGPKKKEGKDETGPEKLAYSDRRRLAVLPLANMSPDPRDEYFADGMTEELISTISKISELSVISRTSVMKFKGGGKTVTEIGNELKAGTLLEGSVRKAENLVRITIQLIDVDSDRHLWSQSYDRELKNIFALQSEIAKQVADVLRIKILTSEMKRIEKQPTESTVAYTFYLKGRQLWNKRGIEDLKRALEFFEQAVKEDPEFALGYVGLADCYHVLVDNWGIDMEKNRRKARIMLAKALELDPGLAEAHTSKGAMLTDEFDFRGAEEEFRKAIKLMPNYATAHHWYFWVLVYKQRWDEAREQIEKAVELDPLSSRIKDNQAALHIYRRDYPTAIDLYKRAIELDPENPQAHSAIAWAYGKAKMYDDMRREAKTYVSLVQSSYPSANKYAEARMAYLEDDKEKVRRLLPELEMHLEEVNAPLSQIAGLYFYIDKKEKGFEWLERAYSSRDNFLPIIRTTEFFDGVRTDPRYRDLLKRLGLD